MDHTENNVLKYCQNKIQDNCNSVKTTRVNHDVTPQLDEQKKKQKTELGGSHWATERRRTDKGAKLTHDKKVKEIKVGNISKKKE